MFSPKRYMLNPDGNNRYWMYKIFYFDEEALAALQQEDGTLGESYEELCGDYEVLPAEQWFRIPGNPYMFQDGPDELTSTDESTHVEAADVVARVSEDNYLFLKETEELSNPTDEDLVNLEIMFDDSVIYLN